jgi:hypothetical protein
MEGGFDAVICLGNSFAHLPDWHGDQRDHRWDFKEGAGTKFLITKFLIRKFLSNKVPNAQNS